MIIAKTIKGKGVSFLEDTEGWHGKALDQADLTKALEELGEVDLSIRGVLAQPEALQPAPYKPQPANIPEDYAEPLSTREAYGHALVKLHADYPDMVVLDAEVSNSTFAEAFKKVYPERFFEMFIAEQNMVGVALGLSTRGKIPFVSTFASFFTRAVDQIRIAQYSRANINFVGSHCGVSIGEDGPTQMGLEDIAIFRAILGGTVLYPADHISDEKLVKRMADDSGISYMRTTRGDYPPLYNVDEEFHIGGSKTLKSSNSDMITVIAAGVTLHEALQAHKELLKDKITIRVIDLYSIKPLDLKTLQQAARETKALLTVEDHFADGGIGDAVCKALADRPTRIYSLAVSKMPKSGTPQELLDYEEISASHIIKKVREIVQNM